MGGSQPEHGEAGLAPPTDASGAPGEAQGADEGRLRPLERLASFRFAYAAIFLFLIAYVFTVEGIERLLLDHFTQRTAEAVRVDPVQGPVPDQIHARIAGEIVGSRWVRWGDVRVHPLVLAADGRTAIYASGPIPLLPTNPNDRGESLLPAMIDVAVSVPHNGLLANLILVSYAALLVATLVIYTRRLAAREQAGLEALTGARDALTERAREIGLELDAVRDRLNEVEPENELYAEEVDALALERSQLLERLESVESREHELRLQSEGARELADERRALEELLEEATEDLAGKEVEIVELRSQVKRTGKGRSTREDDLLERRFRALYKNLEVDEHAISNLVALRDQGWKLRAEEAMKRLCDEPDQTIVRRKLGGLPPHLSIFELAFAGKGRIYYTKGKVRRFRILAVGAKNSQKTDLEYLSRLPKGT